MTGLDDQKAVALESIGSMTEAVARMVDGSAGGRKGVAHALGVEERHLNRMLNIYDNRHFSPDLLEGAMRECQSLLPLEWLAWRMGYAIHSHTVAGILEAIRDSLTANGTSPKFVIMEHGRVEPMEVSHG